MAARSSTAPPACGASTPATAARRSPRRSSSRPPSSTTRRPSRWATRSPSSWPNRLVDIAPDGLDHVFFTNSGSEAVDTALKIALAYHRVRGEGTRTRLIGRERGYHGVGFGGISVGGIVANRKIFGTLLAGVDHLPHTHDLPARTPSPRGEPEHGAELADELERIVALHDASTIAAVIVEPVAGSTGVLIPPKGYLQRLREICTKHGILLIFDEVITGFGRLGTPFAADYFGVDAGHDDHRQGRSPTASSRWARCSCTKDIYDAFMNGPGAPDRALPRLHLFGPPARLRRRARRRSTSTRKRACSTRGAELAPYWEDALHSLKGEPHVIDIRNIGLIGGIELEPSAGQPGARAFEAFLKAFERGVLIRATGDIIALSPPLIITKGQIDELIDHVREVLKMID